ncbi:MAG: LLM class flavin-dependent oxidoreductase [Candidatus Hodarchaeota archaeon]
MYKENIETKGKNLPHANRSLKFYVALQGNKSPKEYIRLGKLIENLGFDRIYVYDDLMFKPCWPILTLIAEHTTRIELGPCLVNGFYSHPAMIAENIAFLDEISNRRAVLGLGRGAFFDFLNMDNSEYTTRKGCEETILLVKRFLTQKDDHFKGEYFEANDKAVLRWLLLRSDIPITIGSWNEKMAFLAGQYSHEMQVANVWNMDYLKLLYTKLLDGINSTKRTSPPQFSIGGMTCISLDEPRAFTKAKWTIAIYLPYIKTIIRKSGIDIYSHEFRQIDSYSKHGYYGLASSYISDKIVKTLSLTGHPQNVVGKLDRIVKHFNISGILFSPPYGTLDSIDENLQLIKDHVILTLKKE